MANKLTIGLVLDDGLDKPDGVQQYILALGTWLATEGHSVHYLVGQTSRTDLPNVHSMSRNIAWKFNGNRGTMPLPSRRSFIAKTLAAERFDILHVQVPYSPFMAHRVIKKAHKNTGVIGTFHVAPNDGLMKAGTSGLGFVLRSSLKRFDKMLSVSPAAQRFAKQTFRVDSQVLPNVVDYPRFHDATPFPQYADELPTILFLGRLVPRKGCQLLLEAVKLLQSQPNAPAFRVLICGRGPLEGTLKQYIEDNKLQNIEFAGFVTEADKPRYYASADISVFPSSGGESFGIVLLEAMASGKSVVLAGDNPGYRSVMESQPELLFDPRSAHELSEKIATQLAGGDAMRAWGETYTASFDVAHVGQQLLTIYDEVLQKRRKQ